MADQAPMWTRDDPWLPQRMHARATVARHERAVTAAVAAAMAAFLEVARARVLGLPDPQLAALTAAAPPDTPPGGQPDPAAWPTGTEWQQFVQTYINPALSAAFGHTFAQLALTAPSAALAWAQQHLATVWDRLVIWPEGAFEEIRHDLIESHAAGESIDQLRDRLGQTLHIDAPSRRIRALAAEQRRIRDNPDSSPAQVAAARAKLRELYAGLDAADRSWHYLARRIARTETMGAVNAGTWTGAVVYAQESGATRFKQWLATDDQRVRDSHRHADGQLRPLTEAFSVGGHDLQYPGEPIGPAHEVIQCRCTLAILTEAMHAKAAAAQQRLAEAAEAVALPDDEDAALTAAGDQQEATVTAPTTTAPADEAAADEPAGTPNGWRGPIIPIDHLSGDGRYFARPDGGVRIRPLPLPLKYQLVSREAHDNAVVWARVDRAWEQDGFLWGEGAIDVDDPQAVDIALKVARGFAGWVSADLDDLTAEARCIDGDSNVGECESMGTVDEDGWLVDLPDDVRVIMYASDWRLMGATLVADPAFAEVRIEVLYDYTRAGATPPAAGDAEPVLASAAAPQVRTRLNEAAPTTITAAGGPLAPPAAWFADPGLQAPTPVVVLDSGRIFGHLAAWNTDHIGAMGARLRPPRGSGYEYFHVGALVTGEGDELAVGTLVLGTSHADLAADAVDAMAHYAHTGRGSAAVRVGEDQHGIWVAGSVLPGVTDEDLAAMRRCPLSGDWRSVAGRMELVAALHVNVPGFPLPRQRTGGDARDYAMVACGALPAMPRMKGLTNGRLPDAEVKRIAAAVADEMGARAARIARQATVRAAFRAVRRERVTARIR